MYPFVPGTRIVAIDKTQGTFNRAARWTVKNAIQYFSEDAQSVYPRWPNGRSEGASGLASLS